MVDGKDQDSNTKEPESQTQILTDATGQMEEARETQWKDVDVR